MRKKNEFKPDKPYSGWLSRRMPTQKQRKIILKWILYMLVLLALAVLQDVMLSRLRLYGATTDLVPCAIFLFCLLEGTENGSLFALIASMLYAFSGTAPGIYSIVLITCLAVFMSLARQTFLQKGFGTAMLSVGCAMVLYELAVFCAGLALHLTYPGRLPGFLITAALSLIAVPVLYPIGLSIGAIGGNLWNE